MQFAEPRFKLPPQPAGMRHRFHAMVKPAGSLCNLSCTYCYYLHKEDLLHQPHAPRMTDEMLERHIRQYIEAQTGDEVVFSCRVVSRPCWAWDSLRKSSNWKPATKSLISASKMICKPTACC